MCFSSQASFVAGSMLIMIGLASLARVRKTRQFKLFPLALTPLLFGIQQLLEGTLWLALLATPRNETLYALGLNGFIWFAMFWWAWWLAFVLAYAETHQLRQRVLYSLMGIGMILGIYLIGAPYSASLVDNHIAYTVTHASLLAFCLYLITGIVPFFISSIRYMWFVGILGFASLILTLVAYFYWTTSIWCFFVALISSGMFLLIRKLTTP